MSGIHYRPTGSLPYYDYFSRLYHSVYRLRIRGPIRREMELWLGNCSVVYVSHSSFFRQLLPSPAALSYLSLQDRPSDSD